MQPPPPALPASRSALPTPAATQPALTASLTTGLSRRFFYAAPTIAPRAPREVSASQPHGTCSSSSALPLYHRSLPRKRTGKKNVPHAVSATPFRHSKAPNAMSEAMAGVITTNIRRNGGAAGKHPSKRPAVTKESRNAQNNAQLRSAQMSQEYFDTQFNFSK